MGKSWWNLVGGLVFVAGANRVYAAAAASRIGIGIPLLGRTASYLPRHGSLGTGVHRLGYPPITKQRFSTSQIAKSQPEDTT